MSLLFLSLLAINSTLKLITILVPIGIAAYFFFTNLSTINLWLNGKPKVQFIVSTTPTVIPPDGSFVKGNASTDTAIYNISSGSKHYVSLNRWILANYPTYIIIDSATLAAYPTGADF
jgi:hypothetical protein